MIVGGLISVATSFSIIGALEKAQVKSKNSIFGTYSIFKVGKLYGTLVLIYIYMVRNQDIEDSLAWLGTMTH
ncbi:MAG: hypothetical protein ABR909_01860 [Candidatus Bathyarchaeia archaeon]|jgi:hypothetical protein